MDVLNNIFENVLFTTFTASILALIILIIRYFFTAKKNIKLNQVLLSIIILRFCIIIVPESNISIFNLLPQYDVKNTITENLSDIHSDKSQQISSYSEEKNIQNNYSIELDKRLYSDENIDSIHNNIGLSLIDMTSIIWLVGFIVIITGALIIQKRFNNKLKLCDELDDINVLYIVNKCKRKLGIKRDVKIYTEKRLRSPFIIGFLTPRIYIPEQFIRLESEYLEHIIIHELAHFKRKDFIYNVLSIFAIAINWFNPLTWKMTSIIRTDIEVACDSYVLSKLGEDKAISYGKSMLEVARLFVTGTKQIGLECYYSNSKKQLERRIKMISKFKKNAYKITAVSLTAATVLGALVFTNPVKAKPQDNPQCVTDASKNDIIESIVINGVREYSNINRLAEDVDYDLMLPKYLPEGYEIKLLSYNPVYNKVNLFLGDENNNYLNINISDTNPIEYLADKKLNTNPSIVEENEIQIGDITGQEVTVSIDSEYLDKHFIKQIDGIYYEIEYKMLDKEELPLSEVVKIIKSLDRVENINSEDYIVPFKYTSIYNTRDIKDARETLGLNFKFIIDEIYSAISYDEESINFFSQKQYTLKVKKNKPLKYIESNDNGKVTVEEDQDYTRKSEWKYINGIKVLSVETDFNASNNDPGIKISDKNIELIWKDNEVYYIVSQSLFSSEDNNVDIEEVAKNIMESKDFDEIDL